MNIFIDTEGGGGGGGDAHRYWRIRHPVVAGTFLEITEVQFHDSGGRVIGTLSASSAPDNGTMGDLNDNNLTTYAYWASTTTNSSAFWIQIDAGSDVEVLDVRIGGRDTSNRYPSSIGFLEWSDNASSWTSVGSASGLTYPGNNTLSGAITFA